MKPKEQALFQKPDDNNKKKAKHKSLDCSIMDVADNITYCVHDFEDGVKLGLIEQNDCNKLFEICKEWIQDNCLINEIFTPDENLYCKRKQAFGKLINQFISPIDLDIVDEFTHPLLKYRIKFNQSAQKMYNELQNIIYNKIIDTPSVQTLEYRGQINVLAMFRAIESDPKKLLGGSRRQCYEESKPKENLRLIADYIAGMTDEYATRMFERIYVPRHGTVFDKI